MYLEATFSTPILSVKDFAKVMPVNTLFLDELNLFRPLEMIALEGSLFKLIEEFKDSKRNKIYQISYDNYTSSTPLYIDARFVKASALNVEVVKPKLPTFEIILDRMKENIGVEYVWGGNYPKGISLMSEFYPLNQKENVHHRFFTGLDCSGLLYYATNGITPRNTKELKSYGEGVEIEGLSNEDIISRLKPLDMVVWKGHVFFILDSSTTIESRVYRGCVYLSDIHERFDRIFDDDGMVATNDPENKDGYVVRRWYPNKI